MKGTIVNIQHYAVHDGPGIRTLVFFKGCPLRCPWCSNPECQSPGIQLRYIPFRCRLCLDCVSGCACSNISLKDGRLVRSFERCHECDSRDCTAMCNHDAVMATGRDISSEELLDIIAADIPFYRNSGGGVTFSGGEPLAQPGFLLEMLQKCRSLGIHTAIETCGWTSGSVMRGAVPFTDLFLYDLKIINPELHLELTGKPVEPVISNLAVLSSEKSNVIVRLPLIPGINDFYENLRDIAAVMVHNHLKQICLVPYHSLGADKYEEHGMNYTLGHLKPYEPEQIVTVRDFFQKQGLLCEVY